MAERPRLLIAGGSGVFGRLLARDLLPLAVRVIECQMAMRRCPECGKCTRAALPAGAPRRPFGVRLTAVIALLSGRYRLSRREVRQLLQDLWEVKLSLGAVVRQEQAQSAVLAPIVAEAQAAVQQAAVINLDETGWRQEDQRAWLWTAVTATLTLFRIDRSRGGRSGSAAGRGVCGGGRVGPLVGVWPIPGRATGAVLRAPQTRRKRSAP